jgi:hypothetical protein
VADSRVMPSWTDLGKKRGIDPLGLQNSSVRLYQELLPGISNVTLRVRYFGLYTWLAHQYALHDRSPDRKNWQRWIRRCEALYALVSSQRGGEMGLGGAEWASRKLSAAEGKRIDFRPDTEPGSKTHYLASEWGVFGLAYQTQLFQTKLLDHATNHDIPIANPKQGLELVAAFEGVLGDVATQFLHVLRRGTVTLAELQSLAPMCPSDIKPGRELDCYQALFLKQDADRRKTLLLVLDHTRTIGHVPSVDELRWAMYSGRFKDGTEWTLSEALARHRERWAIYQANDLVHVALEAMLRYLLDLLSADRGGEPVGALVDRACRNILAELPGRIGTWGDLVKTCAPDPIAMLEAGHVDTIMARRGDQLMEAGGAASALKLLACVQSRITRLRALVDAELMGLDPHTMRSLRTELAFLESKEANHLPAVVAGLLSERVIARHLWVAMRKLRYQREYTFLMEFEDGLIRCRDKDDPILTGPRLVNAIRFLKDMRLIRNEKITSRGLRELEAA